ncbi:MAG: hypothetical protein DRJ34_02425 [Thermoprotei archaeon]|nr:MAG: hypothetical protein DRJ34_02425 [Thermoprotei archaeon]RLE69158.1 MAG: hypothetical protein DRJ45_07005 [Thermoprotei archaeon]
MKYVSQAGKFSIEIEGEWSVRERRDLSGLIICNFYLKEKPVSFNIVCGSLHPSEIRDLELRKIWARKYLREQGYKNIEIGEIYLPQLNITALDVKYIVKQRMLDLTVRKIDLIYKDKNYIFTFGTIPSLYISFEPIFTQAIFSFKPLF